MIENAEQLAQTGDFEEAVRCVQEAENVVGYTERLEDCLTEVYTKKYTDAIAAAFDSGDDVSVIREYAEARNNSYVHISADISNQYSSCASKYLNDVSKNAEDAFGTNKDYSSAIRILQTARAEVDVDSDLVAAFDERIQAYQEYVPVSLTTLEYTQKAKYIIVSYADSDDAKGVNGAQYDENTVISPSGGSLNGEVPASDDEAYVHYNLNLQYSTFTGTIYRPYGTLSNAEAWTDPPSVRVYGDDALLYEAPGITEAVYDPIPFEIDVTGVRNLKIVMCGIWREPSGWIGLYNSHPEVCMAEGTLQK